MPIFFGYVSVLIHWGGGGGVSKKECNYWYYLLNYIAKLGLCVCVMIDLVASVLYNYNIYRGYCEFERV